MGFASSMNPVRLHCSNSHFKPELLSGSWHTSPALMKLLGAFLIMLGLGQGLVTIHTPREGVPQALPWEAYVDPG